MLRKTNSRVADQDRIRAIRRQRGAPATLHRIELQQMRRCRSPALDLIQVHDLEPVAGARIVIRPPSRAECCPQCQPADPTHAVDANSHDDISMTIDMFSISRITA